MEFSKLKKDFLALLLRKNALKISKDEASLFTFKSGRRSPNFVNIGALSDGESQSMLKRAYATAAMHGLETGVIKEFDYVFGPAYKGITLASLACEGLYELSGKNAFLLYDRKEAKAYGDTAADQAIVGAGAWKSGGGVLLVDDVITTGGAKYDALEKMQVLDGFRASGMVIAVDRQEKLGDAILVGDKTPLQALEKERGIKTVSILTMNEIFDSVKDSLSPKVREAWIEYYDKYGAVRLE